MCKPFSDIWPFQLFVNKVSVFLQTSPFAACLRMASLPAATEVFCWSRRILSCFGNEVTLPWRLLPRRLYDQRGSIRDG